MANSGTAAVCPSKSRYRIIEVFRAQTAQGELELRPGQIITLPHDEAIILLNQRSIEPVEKVTYRIFSELLNAYLWVVETDEDKHAVKTQANREPIYTLNEIAELKELPKESLRDINEIKKIVDNSEEQRDSLPSCVHKLTTGHLHPLTGLIQK